MKIHLDEFVRLPSATFIVPGRKVLLELRDIASVFHIVSHISHPVISHVIFPNRLCDVNAKNQRVKRFPNVILILEWHHFEMPLKKSVRSFSKMIAILRQAASRKGSPKATNKTSSIEGTSYFNGAPNNFNCGRIVLERVVVHRKR